jgi:drug/metabolite transporter (DMT)-like permease
MLPSMTADALKRWAPYLVLFAAMLWATDAPFRLHLTTDLSSNFIVLGEHFFDVLIVLPILYLNRAALKALSYKEWLAVLFIAICGSALASVAFTQAFHYVNPSVAILLQKLQPLIAIGLSAALLKEKLRPRFWLFALIALLGAYIISFPHFIPQTFPGESWNPNLLGIGLALIAAFFWGASTVFGRFVLTKVNFKVMTSLRFVLAFVFLIILNTVEHTFPAAGALTRLDIVFILIIALVSGVFSLFIYYRGLEHTQASVATLAELGFPMAAIFVNWIFLGAALSFVQLVGVAVLLFAVYKLALYNRVYEGIQ